MSTGTAITLPNDDRTVMRPEPQGKPAEMVFTHAEKLPLWLPNSTDARQWMMTALAEVNQKALQECTPGSLMHAVFNGAVLGLCFGAQLGHAHIVPFNNNKKRRKEAVLVVGYRGYLEMAYKCGFLKDVQCEVVLDDEKCRRWNDSTGACIEHEMDFDRNPVWDKVKAAYCVWHGVAGGHGIAVVGRNELAKLKKRGNVWNSDTIAMCLKTPLRRAANTWQVTGQIAKAIYLENQHDAEKSQSPLEQFGDVEPPKPKLEDFTPDTPDAPEIDEDARSDQSILLQEYQDEFTKLAQVGIVEDVDSLLATAEQQIKDGKLAANAITPIRKAYGYAKQSMKQPASDELFK